MPQEATAQRITPVEAKYHFNDGSGSPPYEVLVTAETKDDFGSVDLKCMDDIPIRSIPVLIEFLRGIYEAFPETDAPSGITSRN
jgi:hypothetical protein